MASSIHSNPTPAAAIDPIEEHRWELRGLAISQTVSAAIQAVCQKVLYNAQLTPAGVGALMVDSELEQKLTLQGARFKELAEGIIQPALEVLQGHLGGFVPVLGEIEKQSGIPNFCKKAIQTAALPHIPALIARLDQIAAVTTESEYQALKLSLDV